MGGQTRAPRGIEPGLAAHGDAALVRLPEPGNRPEQGGFACAGGPDQRQQFAGLDLKRHIERDRRPGTDRHLERHDSLRPARAESRKVTAMVTSEIASSTADICAAPAMSKACTRS